MPHVTNHSLILISLTFRSTFIGFTATYGAYFVVCYYLCLQSHLLLHIQKPLSTYRATFYGTVFAKHGSVTLSHTWQRLYLALIYAAQLAFVIFGLF